jgi:NAD(P)-dependent dehydrogenase (short-subunit alcohol dehydrogenase family)
MREVKEKVAFITGGGSGLGFGMAAAFLRAGMKVTIADVRQDHLDQALSSLKKFGAVHGIAMDVTDRRAMALAADEAERVFGKIHVLCNNAGVGVGGPSKLATYDDWDWVVGVNLGGMINGVQTFLPRILAHGEGGHIVNTSSMSGMVAHANGIIYITTKFAVVGLSEALRTELAPDNIGVSAFCPGPVNTDFASAGETRPSRLASTGYAATEKARRAHSTSPLFMDADKAGELVLEGIRKNEMYIFTHSEYGEAIRARCATVLAAIPDQAPNPELIKQIHFYLSNPIYASTPKKRAAGGEG